MIDYLPFGIMMFTDFVKDGCADLNGRYIY